MVSQWLWRRNVVVITMHNTVYLHDLKKHEPTFSTGSNSTRWVSMAKISDNDPG